jgi:hypothetical protein
MPTGRKFFIWFKGRTYPPKEIRSILETRPVETFSGGGGTNEMFRSLGFTVVKGTDKVDVYKRSAAQHSRGEPLRQLEPLLDRLLRQKWADLKKELTAGRLDGCPGVYLLAFSPPRLARTPVRIEDIFYVGMSTTSLRLRLGQFWKGIQYGSHHSGADRFRNTWAGGRNFDDLKTPNRFFVATLPIKCEPQKGLRSPADLEQLGTVAALEYLTLARIKRKLDVEPPLNKK